MKKKKPNTMFQAIKTTMPRVHKPTQTHGPSKAKLIQKDERRISRQGE